MIELIKEPTGAIELTKPTGSGSGMDMGYINNTFCNALKGKASGEVVSITDAAPMEHTVSASVESKNIFVSPYTQMETNAMGGITFTFNSDGTITANGTATNNVYYRINDLLQDDYNSFAPIENGTYAFSGCPTGGSASTYKLQFNYFADANSARKYFDDIGSGNKATVSGTAPRFDLWIVIYKDTVCDNLVFKPQVEKGTTVTPYTPYIADTESVKVFAQGKNWYNSSFILGGMVGMTGKDWVTDIRARTDYIEAKPNEYYILNSGDYVLTNRHAYDKDGNWIAQFAGGISGRAETMKTPANTAYIRLAVRKADDTAFTAEDIEKLNTMPIQLELGTTATEYTPYKEPVEVGETFTSYEDMVITTDTVGAIVNVDYNRDINKAFAAIAAATMGANL